LVVESKIPFALTLDQLRRHVKTVKRGGLHDVDLFAMTFDTPPRPLAWYHHKTWSEVYEWLGRRSVCARARRVQNCMVVAEARDAEADYMKNGTRTKFDGVKFSSEEPYEYREAKRVLELLWIKARSSARSAQDRRRSS
jgi:hypothetical protein